MLTELTPTERVAYWRAIKSVEALNALISQRATQRRTNAVASRGMAWMEQAL